MKKIIQPTKNDDIKEIVDVFQYIGSNKPKALYEALILHQYRDPRSVFIVKVDEAFTKIFL